MKYLMTISHRPDIRGDSAPPGFFAKMEKFVGEYFASGVLESTGGLLNTADARRIRLQGGKLSVTDGPFTEAKEIVGGYAIVNVPSSKEAFELAKRFMELHQQWPGFEGLSEIRPMEFFEPAK